MGTVVSLRMLGVVAEAKWRSSQNSGCSYFQWHCFGVGMGEDFMHNFWARVGVSQVAYFMKLTSNVFS